MFWSCSLWSAGMFSPPASCCSSHTPSAPCWRWPALVHWSPLRTASVGPTCWPRSRPCSGRGTCSASTSSSWSHHLVGSRTVSSSLLLAHSSSQLSSGQLIPTTRSTGLYLPVLNSLPQPASSTEYWVHSTTASTVSLSTLTSSSRHCTDILQSNYTIKYQWGEMETSNYFLNWFLVVLTVNDQLRIKIFYTISLRLFKMKPNSSW